MKQLLKRMFTKDEIAFFLEMLCKLNENNAKALKRIIKSNSNKLFEALSTENP